MHDGVHSVMIPLAAYLWNERRILKEVLEGELERRIHLRRKTDMANPIADIQLALTILAEVRQAIPVLAKGIQDLKQTFADKSNPTKAAADLEAVIADLEPLLNQVLALVPPAATPAPTVPPQAA